MLQSPDVIAHERRVRADYTWIYHPFYLYFLHAFIRVIEVTATIGCFHQLDSGPGIAQLIDLFICSVLSRRNQEFIFPTVTINIWWKKTGQSRQETFRYNFP